MKLSKNDIIVTSIVIILSSILLYFYVLAINNDNYLSGGTKLGIITFKKNNASRRMTSKFHWDRLKTDSPVFVNDIIRTADDSIAEIFFDDGSKLEVFENTMIKLFSKLNDQTLDLMNGNMAYKNDDKAKTININGKQIIIDKNTSIQMEQDKNGTTFEVISGKLTTNNTDGSVAVANANMALKVSSDGTNANIESIRAVLQKPLNDEQILTGKDIADIDFSWQYVAETKFNSAVLQVGNDVYFSEILFVYDFKTDNKTLFSAKANLPVGKYYWRIIFPDGKTSTSKIFYINNVAVSKLILPENNSTFGYRDTKPSIQFSWAKDSYATAYLFEIASNPEFTKPTISTKCDYTSTTINSLDIGIYYWRARPIYPKTISRSNAEYEVRKFIVSKSDAMKIITTLSPIDNYVHTIENYKAKGLLFSWNQEREAKEYIIKFFKSPNDKDEIHSINVKKTFVVLKESDTPFFANIGTYYWSVAWIDKNNSTSQYSIKKKIESIKLEKKAKAIYPINGYTISKELVSQLKFSWKINTDTKNISIPCEFILSKDATCNYPEKKITVAGLSHSGLDINDGVWYWCVKYYNENNSIASETEPRKLIVIDSLPPAIVKESLISGKAMYLPNKDITFSWMPVKNADYYTVIIYDKAGNIVAKEPTYKPTTISIPPSDLSQDKYVISIQAHSFDSATSSKLSSQKIEYAVNIKYLSYVELISPSNKSTYDGLKPYQDGLTFTWNAIDKPSKVEVVIKRDGVIIPQKAIKYVGADKVFLANALSGKYTWTVKAFIDKLDISAKTINSFTIEKIPKLDTVKFNTDIMPIEVNTTWLKNNRNIICAWYPVDNADSYTVRLNKKENDTPIATFTDVKTTELIFDNLNLLSQGDFFWTVESHQKLSDDFVRNSEPAVFNFTIKLPTVTEKIQIKAGEFYAY